MKVSQVKALRRHVETLQKTMNAISDLRDKMYEDPMSTPSDMEYLFRMDPFFNGPWADDAKEWAEDLADIEANVKATA